MMGEVCGRNYRNTRYVFEGFVVRRGSGAVWRGGCLLC